MRSEVHEKVEDARTCWIPCTQDDPSISRILLDLLDTLPQLIYALSLIVRITVLVLCSEVPPLKPVDRTEIDRSLGRTGPL